MYWLAIPFALLLFGGISFDRWDGFRHGPDRSVEVALPAEGDHADFTTSDGTVGIPPH